jgi:hypothetical protein
MSLLPNHLLQRTRRKRRAAEENRSAAWMFRVTPSEGEIG